ncbi:hypothetical protein [Microbacterium sp. NPDC089695]|uniref:hypothetical protein n=1 Tax=Microbacterium sp. NPDC089695 TaxID=3364198 RepID=UPI0037F30F46
MENPLVIGALIVAIIVLAMIVPRWIRRSTEVRGRMSGRRFEEDRILEILDDLGATVVLHAPAERARALVDEIVRDDPRRFALLDDGSYGIRFLEPDDAVARLRPVVDGMRLQVERFGEHLGRPNTAEFWNELRARVRDAAASVGIESTSPEARSLFERRDGEHPIWELAELPS